MPDPITNAKLNEMAQNFVLGNGRVRLVYQGPGICDPLCVMDKNALLPFRFQKGWGQWTVAAPGADLILAANLQTITLFNLGIGDPSQPAGLPAPAAPLTEADTNIRQGGGMPKQGWIFFILGVEVAVELSHLIVAGIEVDRPFLRPDN